LIWDLKGQVKVRVTRLSGPNALLNGIFLDPWIGQPGDVAVAPVLSGPFTPIGNTSGGLALHLSGEAGQQVLVESSTDLVHWASVATNNLTSSAVDVAPNQTQANAAHQFYRARALAPAQPQYLIEASSDLIHWLPLAVSASPDDLAAFEKSDASTYSQRYYRATLMPVN
jgi:hypothetical protein